MKNLSLVVPLIILLCLVAVMSVPPVKHSLGDQYIGQLRLLHLAISAYARDADEADDGRPKPFPDSLQDLATYGYFTPTDFENLTNGDLHYYRPAGEPSEKTVVLELRRETNTIYAEWAGSVYSKPRKK